MDRDPQILIFTLWLSMAGRAYAERAIRTRRLGEGGMGVIAAWCDSAAMEVETRAAAVQLSWLPSRALTTVRKIYGD
jgi:hypothetical protein